MQKTNNRFFLISFVIPLTLVSAGFLIIAFFVLLPYLNLKSSDFMGNAFVPAVVKNSTGFAAFSFSELTNESSSSMVVKSVPKTFSLSVPKLNIKDAIVETNSTTLSPDKALGHYKGTALPNERGNVFIYGHSVLPIFYNPKDYKTIFSTLPTLEKGDEFTLKYEGKVYTYSVVQKLTLKPDDVHVFDSNPAKIGGEVRTVTLMTCVPPGAKTFRMLVIGKLITKE